MKQQTAVNWLVDQIKSDQNQKALSASEWMEVIEQAKQMEKEQTIQFADEWFNEYLEGLGDFVTPEQYYNETYNKKD